MWVSQGTSLYSHCNKKTVMSFENCDVVMLPTNEKSKLGFIGDSALFNIDDSKPYKEIDGVPKINFQHLYILSSEEIKEGDWYLNANIKKVSQCTSQNVDVVNSFKQCKKIIATTDKSLTKIKVNKNIYERGEDDIINLPQPSQSFIEYYVSEYNKGNIITEVMVEYEDKISMDGHTVIGSELKINPDNTINIKPIKDSWSREEVVRLINKISEEVDFESATQETIDKWIDENL